jgi:hypothetical protein
MKLLPMMSHIIILCQKIGCLLSFHMLFHCRGFRDLILWVMIVITFDFMCLLGDMAIMIYSGCPKEA